MRRATTSSLRSRVAPLRWIVVTLSVLAGACEKEAGRQAYVDSGCGRCHGSDLSGTRLGPRLTDLKANWNVETLEAYRARPEAVRGDHARLDSLARHFPAPMPQFVMADSVRKALVTYLLVSSP